VEVLVRPTSQRARVTQYVVEVMVRKRRPGPFVVWLG
jgi:hypothetical protein